MFSTTTPSSGTSDVVSELFQFRNALVQRPEIGVSHSSVHKSSRPRKPKPGCSILPSVFRPHVLARDHIRFWITPRSDSFHQSLLNELSSDSANQLLDVLLVSVEPKTHENYGSGLLRFHQFCDSLSIAEDKCLPASEILLAAFIAHWAGKVVITTADNWLAGLHFWHQFNNAPWHGNSLLHHSKAGLSKVVPDSSKRPHRPPVTIEHMHALFQNLDLSNSFDSAVYCTASAAFWCCCRYLFLLPFFVCFSFGLRLGELVIPSVNSFDPSRHISRSTHVRSTTTPNGISFSVFHIPSYLGHIASVWTSQNQSDPNRSQNPHPQLMKHETSSSVCASQLECHPVLLSETR
jgi:hypothetical protein